MAKLNVASLDELAAAHDPINGDYINEYNSLLMRIEGTIMFDYDSEQPWDKFLEALPAEQFGEFMSKVQTTKVLTLQQRFFDAASPNRITRPSLLESFQRVSAENPARNTEIDQIAGTLNAPTDAKTFIAALKRGYALVGKPLMP
ncbi:MAG: hypothetical protein KGQ41_09110 [Alphaproteobacteria bacterium]|nr:hypothetical protein [Alphaproteobacteria bacterium]